MKYERKLRLPACVLNDLFIQQLWEIVQQEKPFIWQAAVGSGGNLLTTNENEISPCLQTIQDREELLQVLQSVQRIDQLTLAFELEEKGLIVMAFKNINKAFGILVVSGADEAWVEEISARVAGLVRNFADHFVTGLFGTIGYGMLHSVIPLLFSSVLVVIVLGLLIPGTYRHSEWIWWISVIGVLITLRLAYSVSNYLLHYTLQKYPYVRWKR
ncbi:MAG: hypothetical protein H6Q65_2776 [Firmicutes bacterium]|nr:hypothetical protein [Bacillota bacterium]